MDKDKPVWTAPKPTNWSLAGRGFDWWATVIVLGLVMGISAYFKAHG